MRLRVRRYLLLTAVSLFAVMVVNLSPVVAAPPCGARPDPASKVEYTASKLKIKVAFRLARCNGEAGFIAGYAATRRSTVPPSDRTLGFVGCFGSNLRSCRVTIPLEHPPVERAEYEIDVFYPLVNGAGLLSFELTCHSAAALATCDL